MRRYNIFYFIKEAFLSMVRNGVMTFASIAVLLSLLVVTGGFALLVVNIDKNLESIGVMKQIVVFCDRSASEEKVNEIYEKLIKLDNIEKDENGNVTGVVKVTKAEALQQMKEQSPGTYDDVTDENNPLYDEFDITYVDNAKVSELDYQIRQIDGIVKVNNRLELATSIENMKSGVMVIFVWFLVVLGVVSVFIIINTIKLSVFSRRNEISIMRYVGATGTFISLPFIIEGIIIGLVSSVIGYFIEMYVYSYVSKMVDSEIGQIISVYPFDDIKLYVLFGFLGVGIVTGIVGSVISLGRYLKQ